MIRFVAAIDNKLGIASDSGIPWDLPTDRQYFRDQTEAGLILMGYDTYKEFKEPMHGKTNYVVSRFDRELLPGFELVNDVHEFLKKHKKETINNIGGAKLFSSTLDHADELVLTLVHGDFDCTKFFPKFKKNFELVRQEKPMDENGTGFHYENWRRQS